MIFTTSVDPMSKIVHCPTLSPKILLAKKHPQSLDQSTEALIFSVYYASINTLEPAEALSGLGTSKNTLLSLYQSSLMNILTQANAMETVTFEMLQALIVLMVSSVPCLRL